MTFMPKWYDVAEGAKSRLANEERMLFITQLPR